MTIFIMQLVVSRAIQTVPYPLLGENTLVLSDSMVLAKDEKGNLALMFRSAFHPGKVKVSLLLHNSSSLFCNGFWEFT